MEKIIVPLLLSVNRHFFLVANSYRLLLQWDVANFPKENNSGPEMGKKTISNLSICVETAKAGNITSY